MKEDGGERRHPLIPWGRRQSLSGVRPLVGGDPGHPVEAETVAKAVNPALSRLRQASGAMSLALPIADPSANADVSAARASGLVLALVAVFLFAVSAFSPAVLRDGDTWSHLATGEWILAHGAVPRMDPFSHSMPGAPWTAHEWLSEILMTLAFRCGGWSGVALLTAAAAAGAALIMGLRVARDLSKLR